MAVTGLCHNEQNACDEIVGDFTNIHRDDLHCSGYLAAVKTPSSCPLVDDGLTNKVLAKCVSSQTPKDYQGATWTRKIYALTVESTARPYPTRHTLVLMIGTVGVIQ